jgi:hypothetical protein
MENKKNKSIEEILNELYSFTTPRTSSSWETNMIRWPVGATTNSGVSEKNFLNRAKEEEQNAKAKPIKPYPLEFVNDYIVKSYTNLIDLKKMLISSVKYPDLSSQEKTILKKEIKKINFMVEKLKEMYYNIEKITL